MASVLEQLRALTPEQRQELRAELVRRQTLEGPPPTVGQRIGRGAMGFIRGVSEARAGIPAQKPSSPAMLESLKSARDISSFEKKERIKAEIKKEFTDETPGGLQIINLPGGGFAVVPGGAQAATRATKVPSTVTGEDKPLELEDITIKAGGVTGKVPKTAEQREREAVEGGVKKGVEEAFKQAEGLKRAVKKVGSITRQFNEALPSGDLPPVVQRIRGLIAVAGAESGVLPNPRLIALQRTAKLQLRAILRDMGEGARLSDQDISQNIKLIEQATLTNEEREALITTYMQTAIDSMDFRTLRVLRDDPGLIRMFTDLGVNLPEEGDTIQEEIDAIDAELERLGGR